MTADSPAQTCRILTFSGSVRDGSLNSTLLSLLNDEAARQGAVVTRVNLRDFALPIYDGDIESRGEVPETVSALRGLIRDHAGLLIACPEHNGSVTALLKNTLDWCSRPVDGSPSLEPFHRKTVLIVGTSLSPFGGLRAIGHLRAILAKMGATVLPQDLAVPFGQTAFDSGGFKTDTLRGLAVDAIDVLLHDLRK